ncbi:MAG: GAF domain-containing protein [Anaerolineales bacterium]
MVLQILAKRANELLGTDSSYIGLWDDGQELTIPAEAHGPNRDAFLALRFAPGEKTLTASVLKAKSVLAIEDVAASTYCNAEKARNLYQGSMLCLPLIAGDRKLGSLVLGFDDLHHFTQDEIMRGEMAARHISLALDKSLSLENAERNLQELALINRIFVAISGSLDLQESLQLIADEILSFLSALHVGIALINEDQTGLVLTADAPASPNGDGDIGLIIPISENPATEKILAEHKPLFIKDAQRNPLTVPIHELMVLRGTQSLHLFPLFEGDKVIGTVGIDFSEPDRDLGNDERRLIETVLLQAGTVIKASHLFQQTQRSNEELAVINEIILSVTQSLSLDEILDTVLRRLTEVTGFGSGLISLWKPKTKKLELVAWRNMPETLVQQLQESGLAGTLCNHVFKTQQTLLVTDFNQIPEGVDASGLIESGYCVYLSAPIEVKGQVLGTCCVLNSNPIEISESKLALMQSVGRQIGFGIENSRLFENIQWQARHEAALFQLSNDIATRLEEKAICQGVIDALNKTLGFTHVGLFLVDESTGMRVLVAGTSKVNEDGDMQIPPGEGLSERPLLDQKLHYTPDVKEETGYFTVAGGSEVDVPVWIDDRVRGVLVAENKQTHAFDKNDFDLLSAVANLTGLALTRSRLFSSERRQFDELAILHAVALAVAEATDEDQLLERATQIIGETLYPDNFGILLVDEGISVLNVHPSYSIHKEYLGEGKIVPLGEGIVGHVVKTGMPERIADVATSPHYRNVDSRTRSELAVPLKIGQRVIGVINAESTKANAFSEADERLLITLAGHLAIAINRLRSAVIEHQWTEKLTRSNALIAALGQVAARIGSAPDIEGIMQTLGDELKKLDITCLVALYTSDKPELAISYTSLPERIVRLFEHVSGSRMDEYRVSVDKLSTHIDLTRNPRPAILTDSIGAAAELLSGIPRSRIADILRPEVNSEDVSIGHFPLVMNQKVNGLLWLWGESLNEGDLPAMSIFANQVAIAIENARLFGEVQRLATLDGLTNLNNRRHFFEMARGEFIRDSRYGRSLSAMLIDIDHFKAFNDNYGHAIGDQVLKVVADLCKQSLRQTDILGRYGGEEFVALLPETDRHIAQTVAERLRERVSQMIVSTEKGDLSVTVSIGVAENNEHTPDLETLVARADQAMYIAKHKGRNQVATSV